MSNITVTLPDGSQQQVPAGTTPIDVARSISRRLADDAVVARVNGELHDLTRPLEHDANAADPHLEESRSARSLPALHRAPAGRWPFWSCSPKRSSASVRRPTPASIYDFYRDTPFTPEDLEKIEAKMWELQKQDLPYERSHDAQAEGIEEVQRDGRVHEMRADRREGRRDLLRVHARTAFHRLLPRPARAVHQAPQSVQTALHRSAPIGRATRRTIGCSASMAPRSSRRKSSKST